MPQIIPIKELKNTSNVSDLAHNSEEPIFVTKNGYGDMVLMSMETYENLMNRIIMYTDLEISARQKQEGKVKDAKASLADMREKYGL